VCERLFGATNTRFIHNLSGNTQITRNVRQVTKAVDPKKLAVWPLAELHQRLAEFFYEVYDTLTHPALGKSPREAFDIGLVRTGNRLHRIVPYNEEFLMLTLPTTAKGTAKVSPSRGVKINHVYYWCQAFRELGTQGETVPVRYDPFDAGIAYAFVRQQWLQCHSEYYATLRDRSEREVMLATKELHQQQHNRSTPFTITARRLAEFLHSVEAEETLLAQRLRDHESKAMRLALTNGATPDAIAPPHHAEAQTNAESPPLNDVTVDEIYGEF
jgi:putative transposase